MTVEEVQMQINDLAIDKFNYVSMYFNPEVWRQSDYCVRKWEINTFPPSPRSSIPSVSGVYAFVVEPTVFDFRANTGLFYIGKATSLYQRIGAYMSEIGKDFKKSKRPHIWRMINQWNGHLKYYFTITEDVHEAEQLENEMLNAFIPYFNREFEAETSQKVRAF